MNSRHEAQSWAWLELAFSLEPGFILGVSPHHGVSVATLGRLRVHPRIKAQYKVEVWGVSERGPGQSLCSSDTKSLQGHRVRASTGVAQVGLGLSAGKGLAL